MFKKVIAFVVALLAGGLAVGVVESASALLYPPPEGLDFSDAEAMKEFVRSLPAGAFAIVLAAHLVGAIVAGVVCTLITKQQWTPGLLGLGGLFFVAGIMNAITIPQPIWFVVLDLLVYFPGVLLGARLTARPVPSISVEAEAA